MKNISEHADHDVVIYLVGNKIDMAEKRVIILFLTKIKKKRYEEKYI